MRLRSRFSALFGVLAAAAALLLMLVFDDTLRRVEEWAASHEFLGDAVPGFQISFAPDHFALLLGADLEQRGRADADENAETNWVLPFLDDYDTEIRFRPEWRWWHRTVECVRAFRARFDGNLAIVDSPVASTFLRHRALAMERLRVFCWSM